MERVNKGRGEREVEREREVEMRQKRRGGRKVEGRVEEGE